MKEIVIVGHGGHAKEVAFLIDQINRRQPAWNFLGYIAADRQQIGSKSGKYPVYESDDWLRSTRRELAVVMGIGDPGVVAGLYDSLSANAALSFPNLIHPNVVGDWDRITLGQGNVIFPGSTFTTDIQVGNMNAFNCGCSVSHDCVLGSYNFISPGARLTGGVVLGDRTLVGAGAQIRQYLKVCSNVVIGAGAVVTKHIEKPGTYVGVPAREMKPK